MSITNDEELAEALKLIEFLWDAPMGTPESDILNDLADEIERYESVAFQWEDDGGKPKD